MKKLLPVLLIFVLLAGCSPKKQAYQITYLDVFDTVTTLRGYAGSQKEFDETAEKVHGMLLEYHQLFDIYHEYGVPNLKTVNDSAGIRPVEADSRLIMLLKDAQSYYLLTGGKVNAAMGSVLQLWHEAREAGMDDPQKAYLPDRAELEAAAEHCSFDTVEITESTVYLSDPLQRLDVGAIAKGWTAQKAAELLPEGYLLNLGGNICARGAKPDGAAWVVGIQHPRSESDYLCTLPLIESSAVTSGDYQRYYTVDGVRYHHIIDPETLMPSALWQSVTIVCPDSGLADCLSTALFLLPEAEGRALAERCGAEVLWVGSDGTLTLTDGFPG